MRSVLAPHLLQYNVRLDAQQWLTNRRSGHRGGGRNFDKVENHILRILNKFQYRNDVYVTTMIDLYGFPRQGNTIWNDEISQLPDGENKAGTLEMRWYARFNNRFFIPYVQVHEFETLILCKPDVLQTYFTNNLAEVEALKAEIGAKPPEEINNTPNGAPSKRIIKYLPSYAAQKTTAGVASVEQIGLNEIRTKCPRFDAWLKRLENLSSN